MPNHEELLLQTERFHVVRAGHPDLPDRAIVRHPGAVTILPFVDDQHICLIRNYRMSVDRTLVELPAGTLEPGESPRETASRELAEETGFRAARLEELPAFFLSPGILDECMHLFVARDLNSGPPDLREDERIENLIVTFEEALEMIVDGRIQDAKTIVGLLVYDLRSRSS